MPKKMVLDNGSSLSTAARVLFGKKWKIHVLYAMRSGPIRLGQLRRLIPEASKKVLTQNLRQLEADGIVVRTVKSGVILHVEYDFAESSRIATINLLDHLARWGSQYFGCQKDEGHESIGTDVATD